MDLPSGTVTFLFTDIEGSTQLWDHDPKWMADALMRHNALLYAVIRANNGIVFKTLGDAFCAAFETAPDALNAAIQAQIQLNHRDTETQRGRGGEGEKGRRGETSDLSLSPFPFSLKVRMALHTGAAEERDDDYFGPTLNRIARLLELSHGGQILLSLPTHELVCESLPTEVSLQDLGQHRLRDLSRPEHVFQLLHPQLPSDFPPLSSLNMLPTNLPQQMTSFIGREREMAEVKQLLGTARLLTLTGAGGCGKTRLALQAAADVLEQYPDGVWLVEFAVLSEAGQVAQKVAQVMAVSEEPGRDLLETLVDALRGKRLLLMFDNCEHLLSACVRVADRLLRSCPWLKILATSREPLGASGEQTYRVPSLAVPDLAPLPPAERLEEYAAVRLFVERIRTHQPDFAVTAANAMALAQVCRCLDGIPLALELAAARTRVLPVEEIAGRLDDRFRLLIGGSRTALPRQQTLRALIDWSYDLLTEPERALLRRLSVFTGGWTLDAAEQVCSAAGVQVFRSSGVQEKIKPTVSEDEQPKAESHTAEPEYPNTRIPEHLNTDEVLDLLTSLVDKSLVVFEEQDAQARYRLLETVRQYAREQTTDPAEIRTLRVRHRDYYLQMAETAAARLHGPAQAVWLERLELEYDNLRAALDWCQQEANREEIEGKREEGRGERAEGEKGRKGEGETVEHSKIENRKSKIEAPLLRLTAALQQFWWMRGHLSEGRERYTAVLSSPGAQGRTKIRADALNGAGIFAWMQGDYAAVQTTQEESLSIQREIGDQQGEAFSLLCLGNAVQDQGDYPAAQALYEQGVALYRTLDNRQNLPIALICLGNSLWKQGDHSRARALFEEALALDRATENRQGMATAQIKLVQLACSEGDYTAAVVPLRECLVLLRQLGDKRITAFALEGCAALARAQGRIRRAALLWGAAQALRETIGSPIPHNVRDDYEREVAAAGAAFDAEAFASAWAEGRTFSFERALVYAQEEAAD